jgi:hypothetical protein
MIPLYQVTQSLGKSAILFALGEADVAGVSHAKPLL